MIVRSLIGGKFRSYVHLPCLSQFLFADLLKLLANCQKEVKQQEVDEQRMMNLLERLKKKNTFVDFPCIHLVGEGKNPKSLSSLLNKHENQHNA